MKIEKFKAGNFFTNSDFKYYVPEKINIKWTWEDPDLNYLLAQANSEMGELNAYSDLIPNIDVYIRMHIKTEANKSNKIEGTNTTLKEDLMEIEATSPEKRKDHAEIKNYIDAMNYGIDKITKEDFPLATRLIKELHEILLKGVRGEYKTPGEYRKTQNFIGGSMPSNAIFVPPPIQYLNDLLNDFDNFLNSDDKIPELIKIAIIHYQFETIHPFLDGNGRLGRLLIPLYLLSKKILKKPCFYISEYFEIHRTEYYDALHNVRIKDDLLNWIKFFLKATIETAQKARLKFRQVLETVKEYERYMLKFNTGRTSIGKTLESMYAYPIINNTFLQFETGLSKPTISKIIKKLKEDDIIEVLNEINSKFKWYCLTKYYYIFK